MYQKLKKYQRIKKGVDEIWFMLDESYDIGKVTRMENQLADQIKVLDSMKKLSNVEIKRGG